MNSIFFNDAISRLRIPFAIIMMAGIINLVSVNSAHADWQGFLNEFKSNTKSISKGKLSSKEIIEGLKEALKVGSKKSIDRLGKQDGFYKDKTVHIPMPENLKKVEKLLINIGQKKLAEKFVRTMNRAAEKSVQSTVTIFVSAIKQLTVKDAMKIYNGREDEATRYFRKTKGQEIHKTIHPIVHEATQKTGVTSTYKKIAREIRKLHPSLADSMPDIDNYVTEKTMDGIFYKLAREEAAIRKDPAARTTEILKKVFSK